MTESDDLQGRITARLREKGPATVQTTRLGTQRVALGGPVRTGEIVKGKLCQTSIWWLVGRSLDTDNEANCQAIKPKLRALESVPIIFLRLGKRHCGQLLRHLNTNRRPIGLPQPSCWDRSEDSLRFPNIWKLPFFSAADNSSSSFRLL